MCLFAPQVHMFSGSSSKLTHGSPRRFIGMDDIGDY
jgi:hypothetical protein